MTFLDFHVQEKHSKILMDACLTLVGLVPSPIVGMKLVLPIISELEPYLTHAV